MVSSIKISENASESISISKDDLNSTIQAAQQNLMSHRHKDGYWWYTLEANDTINAEYIMLLRFLDLDEPNTIQGISNWMIHNQNSDGSWSLYNGGDGDISTTVECYLALKMAGYKADDPILQKARKFILDNGGITKIRIFSRIHLALFGLVSWKICPQMPVYFIQLPTKSPINIYEFSSWARASIVPLLVIMDYKPVRPIENLTLDELYLNKNNVKEKWPASLQQIDLFSIESFFVRIDKALHLAEKFKVKPLRKNSLKKCEKYIIEHLQETEDIYPAMYYGLLALVCLGYKLSDTPVQKAFLGLKSFQLLMSHKNENSRYEFLNQIPFLDATTPDSTVINQEKTDQPAFAIYQQCCVSPVWDTAWASVALLESGISPDNKDLLESGRWLLVRQITDVYGDWAIKNKGVEPGGWSFEFYNKHYPDVDDTIEILTLLHALDLPYRELKVPFQKGLNWLLSMQSKNGGIAAFDKDNELELLNKIPFADHGACLDPPTVDLTGRLIEFLVNTLDYNKNSIAIQRAANFIVQRQEADGSFFGRWGVNYLYGTWCALTGLCALGREQDKPIIEKAVNWLLSVQAPDGGFSEDCISYTKQKFQSLSESTASQTAWGLMGLVAAGLAKSQAAQKAAQFLMKTQIPSGGWEESAHTGTGFPGHFYIRYHGYRHYFPLLALAKFKKNI